MDGRPKRDVKDKEKMRREILAAGVLTAAVLALCGCRDDGADGGEWGRSHGDIQETAEEKMAAGTGQEKDGTVRTDSEEASAGVTFSVMGDSISTYRDYNPEGYYVFFPEHGDVADVADTWWRQVEEDLELTLLVNGSSSGATVSGDSTGTADPQCACNEFRTGALAGPGDTCPDRIIVYLGANDMLESVPPGDNDGTRTVNEGEITNFSDAYTLLLDKLQAKYPSARVYCCTLHPMGNYGTDTPYVAFVNGIGLTSEDYGKVIAGIAAARGLSVIDLYDCGIRVDNLQEMTSDGIHPTAAGMKCIAAAVEEALSCR